MYEYLWNESKLVGQKVGNDAVRILYDANDEPVGLSLIHISFWSLFTLYRMRGVLSNVTIEEMLK